MTSKCGENKKVTQEARPGVSLSFLPHFYVLCNILLYRPTATWNLFFFYVIKSQNIIDDDVINASVLQ